MGAVTLIWFVLTVSTAFSAAAADGTAIAGATSLFAGVFLAFLLEYVKRLPRRPRASRTRAASGA